MPYIDKDARERIRLFLKPASIGELNYLITTECLEYLNLGGKPSYKAFNEIIGVLECAKLEMYRRMVAPYEDVKLNEHGDVF